jgi:hypothetical protein
MSDNYVKELIQVAAVALAAAQHHELGSTDLGGVEQYLDLVKKERHRQEVKWGLRLRGDMFPRDWLAVLLSEMGEVADETLNIKRVRV